MLIRAVNWSRCFIFVKSFIYESKRQKRNIHTQSGSTGTTRIDW